MEHGVYQQILNAFLNYKGIGYASLQYRNKEGELSKRLMNIGAKFDNAKKSDLELIIANGITYVTSEKYTKADWDLALAEKKQSLIKPNENRSNGQKNAFVPLNEDNGSIRFCFETENVSIFGKSERKEVLEAGVYKVVKSSGKTLAKKEIEKSLKSSKFRTLNIQNVSGTVKVNKQVIVVDGNEVEIDVIDIVLE